MNQRAERRGVSAIFIQGTRYALDFAGNGNVNIGNDASVQITGDQTIEFWYRTNNGGGTRRNPLNKAYGGEGTITEEDGSSDNLFSYYYGTAGSNSSPYQGFKTNTNRSDVTVGRWYHVALVRDLQNRTLTWYLNGEVDASASADYSSANSSGNNLQLGNGYTSRWDGAMREFRLWSVARSQKEIQARMNTRMTGTEEGLVVYYDFQEGTGSTLTDLTGNGNNGAISGPSWIEPGE